MKQGQRRVFPVSLATMLFLVVSFNSPPTIPSVPDSRPDAPTPEEVRVLEGLADWVFGGSPKRGFRAFEEVDFTSAVQRNTQSFELFRRSGGSEKHRELLSMMPYGELIYRAGQRHRIDALLLAAIIEAESSFNPFAISPQGAMGLMQIMPATANDQGTWSVFEPSVNVDVGARYIGRLLRQYKGDVTLALAAYNAGPGNVDRYGGIPPFRETRSYVQRVLSHYVSHHQRLWIASGVLEGVYEGS